MAPAPARRAAPGLPPGPPAAPVRRPRYFPATWLHVTRLEQLERLAGPRFQGWCVDAGGSFAVDLLGAGGEGCNRFTGETLHKAISAALRALRGQP